MHPEAIIFKTFSFVLLVFFINFDANSEENKVL